MFETSLLLAPVLFIIFQSKHLCSEAFGPISLPSSLSLPAPCYVGHTRVRDLLSGPQGHLVTDTIVLGKDPTTGAGSDYSLHPSLNEVLAGLSCL